MPPELLSSRVPHHRRPTASPVGSGALWRSPLRVRGGQAGLGLPEAHHPADASAKLKSLGRQLAVGLLSWSFEQVECGFLGA